MLVPGYSKLVAECSEEQLNINKTTIDQYHKYPLGQNPNKMSIVDDYVDIRSWKYTANCFDEILIINSFEHFSAKEATLILESFYLSLEPGGQLFIDVPDIEETLRQMNSGVLSANFAMRHIYGSHKNPFNVHKTGYTLEMLKEITTNIGFHCQPHVKVPHCYPTIAVVCQK